MEKNDKLYFVELPGIKTSPDRIQELKKNNCYPMTWDVFGENFDPQYEDQCSPILSNQLMWFLIKYIKSLSARKLFTCDSSGVIPTAMIQEGAVQEATIVSWEEYFPGSMANWLTKDLAIKWIYRDIVGDLLDIEGKFDITINLSWFLYKTFGWQLNDGLNQIGYWHISPTFVTILQSLLYLQKKGEGIFILPNNYIWLKDGKLLDLLSNYGFCINTIVELPPEVYIPKTKSPMSIFFISRVKTDKTYITFFDLENDNYDVMIQEIRAHKKGLKPSLGYLKDAKYFRSWQHIISSNALEYQAKISNTKLYFLEEIALKINKAKRKELNGGFVETQNSIYFPSIGNSQVVTKLADLSIKAQNYYQIILDETQALAEYVAGFFNSPLGLQLRKSLVGEGFVSKIPAYNINLAQVMLPPINKQIQVLNLQNKIQNFKLNLVVQEELLWVQPKKVEQIRREIERFDRQAEQLFKDWIDSLPFPIASILWRFISDADLRNKVDHLLHFFEAFAQLNTTYLLSAYYANKELFNKYKSKWIDLESDFFRNRRATFGNWVVIGERLARFTREQLSSKEKRQEVLDLFHTENTDFLKRIISKDIYQLLRNVNNYRNNWTGHGGISSEQENKQRLARLNSELTKLREIIMDSYSDFILVQPKSSIFSKGIYKNIVKSLMGSNPLFPEIQIESIVPLDIIELYFQDKFRKDPLPLIGFFRMLPSPKTEQNACYFYNRFEHEGIRFISYHFEIQAEQEVEDDRLVEFFGMLNS